MALFVHVTERCEDEAASAGWQEDLEKLKNKVERAQDLQGFDHFPAPYRVKKKFPRYNARLIASLHEVGEHDIACFLSILTKADSAYDHFQNNPVEFGKRNFEGLDKQEDLQRIVAERTAKTPPSPKPLPSENEYRFLFRAGDGIELSRSDDGVICESPDWVSKVSESPIKDRLTEFHKAIEGLRPEGDFVAIPNRPGWGIFYVQHPDLHMTVLLDALAGDSAKRLPDLRTKYAALFKRDGEVTEESLLRHCQRAYPDYLRFGEDEWLQVQKDAVANIALSPEETRVLEAARRPQGAFPLFINGRAGSGKSTLLQYIFTEHLHRYILLEQEAGFKPPLYLTCSSDLLKHSRSVVEKLLKCNASFLSAGETVRIEKKHQATIDSAFQEFRPFLLSHVPTTERLQRFRPSSRVDYAQFRKLWQHKFGNDSDAQRRFGPDISWHVIRTYVKGMSAESHQDPDDYRQFDAKERQVTDVAFRLIYDRVWDKWYRPMCEDRGFWDDQDLACHLIEQDFIKPKRPAIFCDEAQDFTRLELEIILRLCLFSNRSVAPQQIGCIPLVFAGDPFQTLNPTGFRWEATKAAFVEKFVLSLDPNRRSGMDDLHYRELTYNYRSSRRIVLFSNLVQALRCQLFDLRRVSPQEPWAVEATSAPVVWFDSNDGAFWDRLRRERGVTLIVPCGEGEESEFIQQHLSKWIRLDENGVPLDVNVFSAGRAKGLEFDRVAVFGFGDFLKDDLRVDGDLLASMRERATSENSDKSLPLEYFINRLYVAVSRPKRRLFIVDGKDARQHLWEFATNPSVEKSLLQEMRDGQNWEGKIGGMVEGLLEHFDTEQSTNLEEEAANLETQGLSRSDAYMLRSAANRYRLVGLQPKAHYCLAEALFVDEKYLEAGRTFMDCGHPTRAMDAYWREGRSADKFLLEAVASRPELENRLEAILARFLASPQNYEAGHRALNKLAERTAKPEDAVAITSFNYWTDPARRVAELLIELGEKQKEPPDWSNLSALLARLDIAGFGYKKVLRARVCYLAADWAGAVTLWESANDRSAREYREAKAHVAPYPERLAYLNELRKHDAILEAFVAHPGVPLDGEARRIVGSALVSAKRFREALEQFALSGAITDLADLAAIALTNESRDIAAKCLRVCAVLTVQQSHWAAVREYLVNGAFPKASKESQHTVGLFLDAMKPEFDCVFAASFARSDSLTKLDGGEQKPISKFLRDLDRSKRWQGHISVEEMGAAIERAQRFVDAVEFYETALTSAESDTQKRFAVIRWVKSTERLEIFYRGEKQYRKADEIQEELTKAKLTHDIQPSEIMAEYPELNSLNELLQSELKRDSTGVISRLTTIGPTGDLEKALNQPLASEMSEPAAPVQRSIKPDTELVVGNLKIKVSRQNARINLEHQGSSKTATIRLSPLRFSSEDINWTSDQSGTGIYRSEEWDLSVNCARLEVEGLIILHFPNSTIERILDVK
jgi:hypothetical protein